VQRFESFCSLYSPLRPLSEHEDALSCRHNCWSILCAALADATGTKLCGAMMFALHTVPHSTRDAVGGMLCAAVGDDDGTTVIICLKQSLLLLQM
jgi:hypothetical protein